MGIPKMETPLKRDTKKKIGISKNGDTQKYRNTNFKTEHAKKKNIVVRISS